MALQKKDKVLITKEAIQYLRISRPTFLEYIYQKKIRAVKAGKGWKVLLSELNRFRRGESDTGPTPRKRKRRKGIGERKARGRGRKRRGSLWSRKSSPAA
jgi:excisionase family DNA binding protein